MRELLFAIGVGFIFSNLGFADIQAGLVTEFRFESSKKYSDPFNDVILDAIFTDPQGTKRRVPAFWAGGQNWKVRYSSRIPGRHTFQTESSDRDNSALHAVRGEVNITPYTGKNSLHLHGPIRVSEDRRHFAHADGKPFFWLGDTWWMGLVKRLNWPSEFQELTVDRRDKGFTVVQLVAGLFPDMPAFDERGLGDSGLAWEPSFARIRPEYFDAADQRVEYLVEQGIVPCIFGTWGYYLPWLGTEKMKQHWRYVIARWGALPVVWTAAGEQAMPWYLSGNRLGEVQQLQREWTDVIQYIRTINSFDRMLTTHPRSNARDELLDPALLDFEMQQTGHSQSTERQAAKALAAWNRPPFMPVISGESRYEALEIRIPVTTKDAREAFWGHLLNSGVAGHTYGVNGVWQVNLPEKRFGKSPGGGDWGGTPWRVAMKMPGSAQLGHAKSFLLTLPWHQMEPATDLAKGVIAAAATSDRRCVLIYVIGKQNFSVDLARFKRKVEARWFDPTNGKLQPISNGSVTVGQSRDFQIPGANSTGDEDWVLLIESK